MCFDQRKFRGNVGKVTQAHEEEERNASEAG
jgi:hypothetical protein